MALSPEKRKKHIKLLKDTLTREQFEQMKKLLGSKFNAEDEFPNSDMPLGLPPQPQHDARPRGMDELPPALRRRVVDGILRRSGEAQERMEARFPGVARVK